MKDINFSRLILGGLLAGVIFFVGDSIIHGALLTSRWQETMIELGRAPNPSGGNPGAGDFAYFLIYDLMKGFGAAWLYAAIRARFGAGPTSATFAGLTTWFLAVPTPLIGLIPMHFFARGLISRWSFYAIIPTVLGAIAAGWVYQER